MFNVYLMLGTEKTLSLEKMFITSDDLTSAVEGWRESLMIISIVC